MTSATTVKVFLAEDSALIRDRVAALFAAQAMDVVGQAQTPREAIAGIRAAHPDVVVLDVQLEGGSGLEVLRAVRATDPGIAFVVFTLNAAPAYRSRYLGEGAERFLDKATEFGQLVGAVREARSAATEPLAAQRPWRHGGPPERQSHGAMGKDPLPPRPPPQ